MFSLHIVIQTRVNTALASMSTSTLMFPPAQQAQISSLAFLWKRTR